MEAAAPSAPAPFTRDTEGRLCDVVMKGGITSGIVYPKAIVELARKFCFKDIGGTSAGAIAAAGAAAAEAGWARGDQGAGFEALESMSGWFGQRHGGKSNLLALFVPQDSTRRIFDVLMGAIRGPGKVGKLVFGLAALVWNFIAWAIAGAVPGLLALTATIAAAHGGWRLVLFVLCAFFILLGLLLGALVGFLVNGFRKPPGNWFGLCSGGSWQTGRSFPGDGVLSDSHGPRPLAEWLSELLDFVSGQGQAAPGRPLTFGDLWDAGKQAPEGESVAARRERLLQLDPRDRVIDLMAMTTNLSLGTPYRLPFAWTKWPPNESRFYFDPDELRRVFPEPVVEWMERDDVSPRAPNSDRLRLLPDAPDLPVVVAARLSLSFPYLLSALELYSWDDVANDYVPSWFSDGGISSNFPIHFFDSPLPRRPTVGINLRGPRRRRLASSDYVWLLRRYDEGIEEVWQDVSGLLGFLGSIKDTMQNWRDNTQQRMPGSRDRIAHIGFDKGEGGLNLSMPEDKIALLGQRGADAGAQLRERFADALIGADISFDSHRWIRFRTAMTALGRAFTQVKHGFEDTVPPRPTFDVLAARALTDPPAAAPWLTTAQQTATAAAVTELKPLVDAWVAAGSFEAGTPQPPPVLRMGPET